MRRDQRKTGSRSPRTYLVTAVFLAVLVVLASGEPLAAHGHAELAASPVAAERVDTMSKRPIAFTTAYGTYAVNPDGSGLRQLNRCTLDPLASNGRSLIGWMAYGQTRRPEVNLLPVAKELVADCDDHNDPARRATAQVVRGGPRPTRFDSLDWSPTASLILATEQTSIGGRIVERVAVLKPDGTGHRVVEPRGLDEDDEWGPLGAAWSPRGDQIVFGRTFRTGECPENDVTGAFGGCSRAELAIMNRDGSGARSLYRPPQVEADDIDDLRGTPLGKLPAVLFWPFAWHGQKVYTIIYEETAGSNRLNNKRVTRLAVVNTDGSGFRYLTPAFPGGSGADVSVTGLALSPDGKQIAMLRSRALALMSSNGGPIRTVRIRQRSGFSDSGFHAITW